MDKPKIVVLCGSSRFVDLMAVCAWIIERDEKAITMGLHLLPDWYPNCPDNHLAEHEGVADAMDELHLRKIDLADEIFVVNWQDYIGDSTNREIQYAVESGKAIRWLSHDPIGEKIVQLATEQSHDESQIIEFVDDQPITPMPESCPMWPCCDDKEKNKLIKDKNGFMICPSCRGSYGQGK